MHNAKTPRKRGRPRKDWSNLIASLPDPTAFKSDISPSTALYGLGNAVGWSALKDDNLQLFYHFMSPTADAFGDVAWRRDVIVPLGFDFPVILHLVLAFSALHLSKFRLAISTKYAKLADHHCAKGLRLVRDLLRSISNENCAALYFSTVLVCCITFARGPTPDHLMISYEKCDVAWWQLIRGVRLVIETIGLETIMGLTTTTMEQPVSEPLARLIAWEEQFQQLRALLALAPEHDLPAYQLMLTHLTDCFRETFGTQDRPASGVGGKMEVVMTWLYRMDDRFELLLRTKQPIAMIILAYFAVPLSMLEHIWFMRGWASHILEQAERILERDLLIWIHWPRVEIEMAT